MKKYIALFLCLAVLFSFAGCKEKIPVLTREEAAALPQAIPFTYTVNTGGDWAPLEHPTDLSLLCAEIHRGVESEDLETIEVFEPTNEDLSYYYDIEPIEGSHTSMMQAFHGLDHFFLLTELPQGADADSLVKQLRLHRPCEWCPGEGPEENTVVVSGNYVLLLIAEEDLVAPIVANFKAFTQ